MPSPLKFLPWPSNVRFRVKISGVWTDITRWVKRQGTQISFSVDTMTAESTIVLEIPASETMPIFEAWQEVRIDNPLPQTGTTYERYFKGYIGDFNSDPAAPSRRITLHVLSGMAILEKARNAIIGPYTYPAGTADNVIIADLVTYADMAAEISTVPSVNHVFDIDAEITFQNCTLLEALQQLQQATPAGIEAPALMLYWRPDDPPTHSDDWTWTLQWFQSTLIPLSGIKLTDGVQETTGGGLGEAFYRALSRMRDGKRVINRQTVIGAQDPVTFEPITVTVNSVTSQTYLGRILAGKPIVDTTLDTVDKVTARARLEIDRWKDVLETLNNIQTLVPYGVSGPIRVQIKRAIEPGIDTYQTYIVSKISLAWDTAGLAVWTLVLGTALPELGRSGYGWRGGIRFQTPTAPPQVTGVSIAENVYIGQSHSSRFRIVWTPLGTGNIHHYRVEWRWFDGTWHAVNIDVPHPTADVYIVTPNGGLIPGTRYYVTVQAWNIFNQYGPPSATVDDIAAARTNPPPPTGFTPGTPRWDDGGAVQPITIALPVPQQDFTRVVCYETATPANIVQDLVINGSETNHTIYMLTRGLSYTVELYSRTQWHDESLIPTTGTFTAATEDPDPPTDVEITPFLPTNGTPGTGALKLSFTHTTFIPRGDYEVWIQRQGGQIVWYGDVARDTNGAVLAPLPTNRPLVLSIASRSRWGYAGTPYVSDPFTIVAPGPVPPGTDTVDVDNAGGEYFEIDSAGAPDLGQVEGDGYRSNRCLAYDPLAAGDMLETESTPFFVTAGEWVLGLAFKSDAMNQVTFTVEADWHDATNTYLATSVFSVPGGLTDDVWNPVERRLAAPADTALGVLRLRAESTGAAWVRFSLYKWDRAKVSLDILDHAIERVHLQSDAVQPEALQPGLPVLLNGSLEIPDLAGTTPAGWSIVNQGTYSNALAEGAGDGQYAVRLGGAAGTHALRGPKFQWTRNRPGSLILHWKENLSDPAPTSVTGYMRAYNAAGSSLGLLLLADQDHTDLGFWDDVFGILDANLIPAATAYLAPEIEIGTANGTQRGTFDSFRLEPVAETVSLQVLQFRRGNGDLLGAVAYDFVTNRLTTGLALELLRVLLTSSTPFNVPWVTVDPSSPAEGDIWFKVAGSVRQIRARQGGADVTLASSDWSSGGGGTPAFASLSKWGNF